MTTSVSSTKISLGRVQTAEMSEGGRERAKGSGRSRREYEGAQIPRVVYYGEAGRKGLATQEIREVVMKH